MSDIPPAGCLLCRPTAREALKTTNQAIVQWREAGER